MALSLLRTWVHVVGKVQMQSEALVSLAEPRHADETDVFARVFVLSLLQHLETQREPSSAETPYDSVSFGLAVPGPAALDLLAASSLSSDIHPLDVVQWLLPLPKNTFASRALPTSRVLRGRAHRVAASFALSQAALTRPLFSPAAYTTTPRFHTLVRLALERLNTSLLHTPIRLLSPANVFGSTAAACGNVRQAPSRADASLFICDAALHSAAATMGDGPVWAHYANARRAHAVGAWEGFAPEELGNVSGGGAVCVAAAGTNDDFGVPSRLEPILSFFCEAPDVYAGIRSWGPADTDWLDADGDAAAAAITRAGVLGALDDDALSDALSDALGSEWDDDYDGDGGVNAYTSLLLARVEREMAEDVAAPVGADGPAGLDEAYARATAPVVRDFRNVLGQQGAAARAARPLQPALATAAANVRRVADADGTVDLDGLLASLRGLGVVVEGRALPSTARVNLPTAVAHEARMLRAELACVRDDAVVRQRVVRAAAVAIAASVPLAPRVLRASGSAGETAAAVGRDSADPLHGPVAPHDAVAALVCLPPAALRDALAAAATYGTAVERAMNRPFRGTISVELPYTDDEVGTVGGPVGARLDTLRRAELAVRAARVLLPPASRARVETEVAVTPPGVPRGARYALPDDFPQLMAEWLLELQPESVDPAAAARLLGTSQRYGLSVHARAPFTAPGADETLATPLEAVPLASPAAFAFATGPTGWHATPAAAETAAAVAADRADYERRVAAATTSAAAAARAAGASESEVLAAAAEAADEVPAPLHVGNWAPSAVSLMRARAPVTAPQHIPPATMAAAAVLLLHAMSGAVFDPYILTAYAAPIGLLSHAESLVGCAELLYPGIATTTLRDRRRAVFHLSHAARWHAATAGPVLPVPLAPDTVARRGDHMFHPLVTRLRHYNGDEKTRAESRLRSVPFTHRNSLVRVAGAPAMMRVARLQRQPRGARGQRRMEEAALLAQQPHQAMRQQMRAAAARRRPRAAAAARPARRRR